MAKATATQAKQDQADQAEPAKPAVEAHDAELPKAAETAAQAGGQQIDLLLETDMEVSVCLGKAELQVRDLLQAGPGSVIKLDRKAGEPVDLYLRGVRFATGSLVVIGEQLGVRVREILPAASAHCQAEEPDG